MLEKQVDKQKLFGLYIDSCEVNWWREEDDQTISMPLTASDFKWLLERQKSRVLLKSLENLSREDAIYIYCKEKGWKREDLEFLDSSFKGGLLWISVLIKPKGMDEHLFVRKFDSEMADYLRNKGYAIPYMGIPVEEFVKMGWMELIKEEKLGRKKKED